MAFEAYADACQAQHLQNHNGCEMPMSPEEPLALLEWTAEPPMLEILICILQKCRKRRTLGIAEHVHAHVCNIGLEVHKALGNYLISMFVECGSLSYAQQVFSRLVHRNEHSWTSLLQGCIECDDLQHAFHLYQQMQEDGVHPSRYTFVPLLTACTRLKSLEKGLEIHGEIAMEGFEEDIFLCNALVSMYAKCGSLTECEELFNTLPSRDVVSWTALIVGYVEQGLGQKALNCWERMQLEEVAPDSISYVCGLKACGSLRAINRGQEIHAGIVKEGLKSDLMVANTLVDMYAKCGSLEEAQKVFDELCVRDIVTWTALISGYAEYGLSEEALNCLEQMELEGIHWDPVILVSGLKASGSLGAVNRGQKIHAEIVKQGFENISFVGSTLVGMYAKCGLFVEAHEVLDTLPIRDAVSWNALISGYAEHGYGEKSLDSFEQMQLEGVSQDPVTYLSSLKACGDVGDLQRGQAIHGQITKTGFGRDATIGNMLVYMYVKCDSFLEAWEVFDELPVQDVVSWTSLIAGYADRGFGEDALDILEQMQLNGVSTDNVAFLCGLKTCGSIGASGRGREIHVEIVKNGFDRNPLVGNTLVDMYAKCGLLVEAHQVFHELSVQDLVSWNALISGYAEQGLGEEALECFEKMRLKDMSPDAVTFVGILKACGGPEAIHRGLTLHAAVVKQGLERDHIVGNALVEMYAKCSPLKVTHEIFYKMPVGDVVSWNTLIGLYVEQGLHEEALSCFQQMQFKGISPDRVSWSGLILAYAEQGESEKAVNFYAQMQGQSLTPDNTVLLSVLKACVNTAMMEMGRRIHAQVARLETMEVNLATAFIDMYGRCGSMTDAQQLFDAMRMRDLVTWDALIRGYARQGDTERVFHLFETLMEEGLQPDDVMFLTVLSLCMHVGLVEKAQKYFEVMSKDYGLTPSIKHVTCMIDLLGRAGQLDEAVRLVEKMPFQPNLVVWHTMLGACQKWGNTELGRWAFEHAVGLDRKHATAYVLMSNIYVDAHMWEEAAKIEAMRMEMQKGFMSSCLASSNAGEEEDSLIPPF